MLSSLSDKGFLVKQPKLDGLFSAQEEHSKWALLEQLKKQGDDAKVRRTAEEVAAKAARDAGQPVPAVDPMWAEMEALAAVRLKATMKSLQAHHEESVAGAARAPSSAGSAKAASAGGARRRRDAGREEPRVASSDDEDEDEDEEEEGEGGGGGGGGDE